MIVLVIEEEELKYNEDGQIIGYEGEGKAILLFVGLGLFCGFIWGFLVAAGPVPNDAVLDINTALPDAEAYCEKQGFDWGTYGSGPGIATDRLSITCHPKESGTWTTYYFDLNMTQVGTEVTTRR